MIDERNQELASLYALELLAGDERSRFERELARNADLGRLVAELRAAAAELAHTASPAEPPAALRGRILASVAQKTSAPATGSLAVTATTPRRAGALFPWVLAAGFALGTVWFGARYVGTRAQADQLAQQMALADVALKSARLQIETEQLIGSRVAADFANFKATADRARDLAELKISALTSMLKNSPHALAVAVWDPRRDEGVFTVEKLPPNAADQRYELWLIDSKPVSAGIFAVAPDGHAKISFRPTAQVKDVTKFAVSREKNDGLPSHTAPSEVVMLSE